MLNSGFSAARLSAAENTAVIVISSCFILAFKWWRELV